MKKVCPVLLVALLLSCTRGEPVRIKGTVENGQGMIFLDEQGLYEVRKIDSTRLHRNGRFELGDRISVPTFYNLHMRDRQIIPLLLRPGETAVIRTTAGEFAGNYEVSGSEESKNLQQLNNRLAITRHRMDSLSRLFEDNRESGDEVLRGIRDAYKAVVDSQRRFSIKFVINHRNSLSAIYALYQKLKDTTFVFNSNRDIQLFKITSIALDTLYPGSEYVQSLKRDAANLESHLQASNWKKLIQALPSTTPDIRLPNPGGDTIALSSFRNKVVLLSFWASWNQESVALNQEFKSLYGKYHRGGLEIYQVSFDSDLRKWMDAIRFDELPWTNVSELSYPESIVAGLYNITDIPTYYLIDRNGEIIGKNFDRVALDRKISELINQN
jgi:peroxiredoxin